MYTFFCIWLLRLAFLETDSEMEIDMQEVYWGVFLATLPVKECRKEVSAEEEVELRCSCTENLSLFHTEL